MGLPVFSCGGYAQDQGQRGNVVDFRVAVEINGVLVIPRHAEEEAIRKAIEKAGSGNSVRLAIQNGMSTVEAFKTFG